MSRASTAVSYERRLRRVADHVWAHLDEPLDLAALAEIACFSPFHFHRTYRAMLGETAAETVSRLRLMRAASQLQRTRLTVAEISRRAGYASPAAFTRAFRAAHGTTPAAFRAQTPRCTGAPVAVEVRQQAALRLAAVPHRGPPNEVGRTFEHLMAWAGPRGLAAAPQLGVAVWLSDMAIVPPAEQQAVAGLTVGPEVGPDGTVSIYEVPAGRHAVVLHKGPFAKIGQAYDALFAWLPTSGETRSGRPMFEINLNDPRGARPQELLTEICLPLADRSAGPAG